MVYDVAIVGTGPAGISAALNLKIHNKNFIWLGNKNLSEKIQKAPEIANYPGFYNISGEALNQAFLQQIRQMDIGITECMVNSIMPFSGHYALMAGSTVYEAKAVILTTGIANVGTLPGESELVGKGVSYCATCDGGLYRNRTIAVFCNHPRFEHEVRYLAEIAAKVYYFSLYTKEKQPTEDGKKYLRASEMQTDDHADFEEESDSYMGEHVQYMKQRGIRICGEEQVTGVELKNGTILEVDGVFCLRDSIALSALLPKMELEDGHIRVNRRMETNLAGCFAAGDCTGRPYQYTKAVGEGNVAAHAAIEYLSQSHVI